MDGSPSKTKGSPRTPTASSESASSDEDEDDNCCCEIETADCDSWLHDAWDYAVAVVMYALLTNFRMIRIKRKFAAIMLCALSATLYLGLRSHPHATPSCEDGKIVDDIKSHIATIEQRLSAMETDLPSPSSGSVPDAVGTAAPPAAATAPAAPVAQVAQVTAAAPMLPAKSAALAKPATAEDKSAQMMDEPTVSCAQYQSSEYGEHMCHKHAHWARNMGVTMTKERDSWYGAMAELISVKYQDATADDFQLYFHCGGQPGEHQRDCNAPPCKCSRSACRCNSIDMAGRDAKMIHYNDTDILYWNNLAKKPLVVTQPSECASNCLMRTACAGFSVLLDEIPQFSPQFNCWLKSESKTARLVKRYGVYSGLVKKNGMLPAHDKPPPDKCHDFDGSRMSAVPTFPYASPDSGTWDSNPRPASNGTEAAGGKAVVWQAGGETVHPPIVILIMTMLREHDHFVERSEEIIARMGPSAMPMVHQGVMKVPPGEIPSGVIAEAEELEKRGFTVVRGKHSPAHTDVGRDRTKSAVYQQWKLDQMLDYYDSLGAALGAGSESGEGPPYQFSPPVPAQFLAAIRFVAEHLFSQASTSL